MLKLLDMPTQSEDEPTNPNIGDVGRIAYLTFDDGPSRTVTPEVLKILNQYDIKATFFVLGTMAEESPDILKDVINNGHRLGNHGYSHKYDVIYKNMDNFLGEVSSTDRILKQILGQDFTTDLFRFPGGSFESYKNPYIDAVKNRGYRVYDWNVLNGDAEALNVPKDVLITNLKTTESNVKSGNIIVLMHDGYGKETTVEALPTIIEYLINKGYSFRTL